jgi:hypothetical protein
MCDVYATNRREADVVAKALRGRVSSVAKFYFGALLLTHTALGDNSSGRRE